MKIFLGKICQNFGKKCPVRLFPGEFVTPPQNISKYKGKRSGDQPSKLLELELKKFLVVCDSFRVEPPEELVRGHLVQ